MKADLETRGSGSDGVGALDSGCDHSELESDNVLEMSVTNAESTVLMLLREENAAECSASPAAEPGDRDRPGAHALDPRYRSRAGRRRRSVLADCLVIRERLDQACVEIQRAISSVRDRLDGIADRIDGSTSVAGVG